jgi:hypothetical protein
VINVQPRAAEKQKKGLVCCAYYKQVAHWFGSWFDPFSRDKDSHFFNSVAEGNPKSRETHPLQFTLAQKHF